MSKLLASQHKKEFMKKIFVILLTGITGAMGLNLFLIPAKVFSAGMNGIAQILATLLQSHFSLTIDTGVFILLLNLPIFLLGFWKLGREATIFSFVNVAFVSVVTLFMPVYEVTDNPLMNAIVGGVLIGIGAGLSLKMGFTTGGMDIVSLVLSKTTGRTVGNYIFALNSVIVAIAGFLFNWESALYTIISIYCMTQVIDALHTSHQKVTAMIVTTTPDVVVQGIASRMARGMTLLPSTGGYSKAQGQMIMMVVTRYELYDLEQVVHQYDENAFMNIVPTQTVLGRFANEDEQRLFKSTGSFPEIKARRSRS